MGNLLKSGLAIALIVGASSGCAKNTPATQTACEPASLTQITGNTGVAKVFQPDPIVSSGNQNLSPTDLSLDNQRVDVALSHLSGLGVLKGDYVDVRDGNTASASCFVEYGAHDSKNNFSFSHSNSGFSEAMAYYYGDQLRSWLDSASYLQPAAPVKIIAHCMKDDNAFFERGKDSSGNIVEFVCLGDSVSTHGASYADDAIVTMHELEHATTVHTYSTNIYDSLGPLFYDEAGSLNEAVSDFMGLISEAPMLVSAKGNPDPELFSRWALGTFGKSNNVRGAHKCPMYDLSYPKCDSFPAFSADKNTISYVYPDGMGWPYANNFSSARSAFLNYYSEEEIHNAGVILEGALWDVYDALGKIHGEPQARIFSAQVLLEAIKHLPKMSLSSISPVTFRGLADLMVNTAAPLLGISAADQNVIAEALGARGLIGGTELTADWATVGRGTNASPGIRVIDDATTLRLWIHYMFHGQLDAAGIIKQGINTRNGKLDPGEVDAIFFDIKNNSAQTAGGVQLTITSLDPDVTLSELNMGLVAPASRQDQTFAQIVYQKIYGSDTVAALTSINPSLTIPIWPSYFGTDEVIRLGEGNPNFDFAFKTAVWVEVSPTAAHGKTVGLRVDAKPTNGEISSVIFPVTIN